MLLPSAIPDGDPVRIGMIEAKISNQEFDLHTACTDQFCGVRETFIGDVPTHETCEQAHVGPLALMRGGKRAIAIELDEDLLDISSRQVSCKGADTQCRRTV
jgi:hypothetical protein